MAAATAHPFAALVAQRGGAFAGADSRGEGDSQREAGASFVAVLARADDILPPIARLTPKQAAAWSLLTAEAPGAAEVDRAQALAAQLRERPAPAYLLTAGRVGGGEDEPRSRPIEADLVARVLDAASRGSVEWEADPDFGYELAVDLPGLAPAERNLLVPRFLWARSERVYDYAAIVPQRRRARRAGLERLPGLEPSIAAAVGPSR